MLTIACVDHASFTVPHLDEAVDFFTAVLGARLQYRRAAGPLDAETAASFGVALGTTLRLAKLDLAGMPFELFEYREPGKPLRQARNAEPGGGHLGLTVADVDAAAEILRGIPGVQVCAEPSTLPQDHPLAGRRWVYFTTPWGLQLELVSPRPQQPWQA